LAVFLACLNALAVGAPLLPALRIFSPEPLAILLRLAWMFAYNPLAMMFVLLVELFPRKIAFALRTPE